MKFQLGNFPRTGKDFSSELTTTKNFASSKQLIENFDLYIYMGDVNSITMVNRIIRRYPRSVCCIIDGKKIELIQFLLSTGNHLKDEVLYSLSCCHV